MSFRPEKRKIFSQFEINGKRCPTSSRIASSFDMTKTKRLLLFDIDSTLVATLGAGIKALQQIIERRYGARDDLLDIEIAGRTDTTIARSILLKYRVEPTRENLQALLEEYLIGLEQLLPQLEGRVLPGIREILERIKPRTAFWDC
jgi:phosphoglycolate phosphatase